MNQGYLRMLVLELLAAKACSGYTLVKTIHDRTGWKPSYGSIYPLLERLENEDLVTVEEQGRSKVYTLTPAGLRLARDENETRNRAHTAIIEQLTVLAGMGDEHAKDAADMLRQAHTNGRFPETPELIDMRREVFRIFKDGHDKTHRAELKTIFTDATKKLKKIG